RLTPPSAISTLSLHDALPISERGRHHRDPGSDVAPEPSRARDPPDPDRAGRLAAAAGRTLRPHQVTSGSGPPMTGSSLVAGSRTDRKSTRLNSSHVKISYAVF